MEAEIPECMYEARMEDIAADFENRLARTAGLTLDEYLKYTGADKETFFEGFKPQAERQVKIRLALEEIAKLEKIEMTEEEMNEEFKVLAERYEMKEEQVRKIVPAEELALDLCVEKAIKLVRDAAKVTEITAEEAAAKEAAPKKKRTTKKKTEEAPAEAPAAEGEEAPAPKKRATRKKKTEEIDPSVD
jgi:trigger factor